MAQAVARIGRETYATEIEVGGHRLTGDEPARNGGRDAGPAPYDFLLAGLGSCTAITLRMYADRKQWPLAAVEVGLRLARGDDGTVIARTLRLTGALDADQVARLADIAERTPVTLTLKQGARIDTTVTAG
ncbi:osmotically inducible protein C [Duganella sp. Leaf126]|uniref:OsmC family protein n=1 Tax=Duganella sp. Leaf126 TaxID=1736266 RepID=UPI0006F7593D|nr:OsmC family protein [Duganella sp. Leaf126]KQQ32385.1 osmotically inducible protein C [Duganella sp. Leaf126]